MKRLALLVAMAPALAHADDHTDTVCDASVNDPIVTPVRDVYLDAQRGACLRTELSAGVAGQALIDTPGFHGVLGGDFALGGRVVVAKAHELSVQLRVIDFGFVQNAVNKVTHAGFGPLVVGAAAGASLGTDARVALVARIELPYTRDQMDTLQTGGELGGVATARLRGALFMHSRLGAVGMIASSLGGSTRRLAFRAGADLAWHVKTRLALQAGAEAMAGWDHGFDHVLVRAGVHWRAGGKAWRVRGGVAVPLGGAERTHGVIDLGLVHDL